MFELHPRLQQDLLPLGELSSSLVFLLPDSHNPWVILVPPVANISEWHHLSVEKQMGLLDDINRVSQVMESEFKPDKINIGSLGNMVPQLHIHIIGRFREDPTWPGSAWGQTHGENQEIIDTWMTQLKKALS